MKKIFLFFIISLININISTIGAIECFNQSLVLSKQKKFKELNISLPNCLTSGLSNDREAEVLKNIGNICYKNDEYLLAIKCYEELLKFSTQKIDSTFLFEKIGSCHYFTSEYSKALLFFKLSIKNIPKESQKTEKKLIHIYRKMGSCYKEKGDFKKALGYYYKSSEISINIYGLKHIKTAITYEYLADMLILIPKLDEAESLLKESIQIKQSSSSDNKIEIGNSYISLADLAFKRGQFNHSIKYNKLALKNYIASNRSFLSYEAGIVFNRLGDCNLYMDNFKVAIKYYSKFIKCLKVRENNNNLRIAYIYSLIGACYSNMRERDKANFYFEEFFKYSKFDPKEDDYFNKIERNFKIPISLFFKAQNHLFAYKENKDLAALKEAHYWFGICLEVVERINASIEGESKQFLLSNFYYIFESILETCYLLHEETGEANYIEEALQYAELSRSVLLRDAIKEASVEIMNLIPDSILVKEEFYQKKLASIEEEIFNAKKIANNTDEIVRLNGLIFNLREEKNIFHTFIKKTFPAYYKWRYRKDKISVASVRKILRPEETLIHYFWGDESLFTIIIGNDVLEIKKQPIDKVKENILHFRNAMASYPSHTSDSLITAYISSAHELYKTILAPWTSFLGKKILIAPDGQLEYISFDALLSSGENHGYNWGKYPYLIKDYQFRYTHSIQLLLEHLEPNKNNQKLLAIAPTFSIPNTAIAKKWNLGPLFKNKKEVQQISQFFDTKIMAGEGVKKSNFIAKASAFAGLHFATHAIANDADGGYSFIYFSPEEGDTTATKEVLYAKDICLMNLHADMVVLSACETAAGENQRGEGIISLGRSFSFAGASSLITTLWKVDDATAAQLMTDFYSHLSMGEEKDIALRNAKLNLIQEGKKHPFFWAPFIPHGDMSIVNFKPASSWDLLMKCGLGLITLSLLFLIFKRVMKSKNS